MENGGEDIDEGEGDEEGGDGGGGGYAEAAPPARKESPPASAGQFRTPAPLFVIPCECLRLSLCVRRCSVVAGGAS